MILYVPMYFAGGWELTEQPTRAFTTLQTAVAESGWSGVVVDDFVRDFGNGNGIYWTLRRGHEWRGRIRIIELSMDDK